MSDGQVKDPTITVKKQTIVLKVKRSDMVDVKGTGDGIVFNLLGGLFLTLTDINMPLETKQAITTSFKTFTKVDIIIDLMNYVKPVFIDQT